MKNLFGFDIMAPAREDIKTQIIGFEILGVMLATGTYFVAVHLLGMRETNSIFLAAVVASSTVVLNNHFAILSASVPLIAFIILAATNHTTIPAIHVIGITIALGTTTAIGSCVFIADRLNFRRVWVIGSLATGVIVIFTTVAVSPWHLFGALVLLLFFLIPAKNQAHQGNRCF